MTSGELLYTKVEPGGGYYLGSENLYCIFEGGLVEPLDPLAEPVYEYSEICDKSAVTEYQFVLNHGYFWRFRTSNVGYGMGVKMAVPEANPAEVSIRSSVIFSVGWIR